MSEVEQVDSLLQLSKEELALMIRAEEKKKALPHLYSQKFYDWSRAYFESTNRMNLLCSANQIGKSSINIRKCINWATDKKLWPILWNAKPNQFWYMYPSKDLATIEFETKWKPLLPLDERGEEYGYEVVFERGDIYAIKFRSGVTVYFKTYAQDKKYLQAASVYAVFADEEMPENIFDEVMFRISATSGYFHMVFTATLGQRLWWDAMEEKGEKEKFPGAWKKQVSMYDCLEFEDGTPGVWSVDKIRKQESMCKDKNEVLRRIYGRFVTSAGLIYPTFDPSRHMKPWHPIPDSWIKIAALDYGSGGKKGHKAGILFLAVHPNYKSGRAFKLWRGDGDENTTAGDVISKYLELRVGIPNIVRVAYDPACKDLKEIAGRVGLSLSPAQKGQNGYDVLNTLFKNDMLYIYDTDEGRKLSTEIVNLRSTTAKQNAQDDLADCLRYACAEVGWDFSDIGAEFITKAVQKQITEEDARRQFVLSSHEKEIEDEFEEWNEQYGS